jgi:hypothetical protein
MDRLPNLERTAPRRAGSAGRELRSRRLDRMFRMKSCKDAPQNINRGRWTASYNHINR